MAIRRWAVRPDVIDERTGLEFVSREAMAAGWGDADSMIARAGGVVTVVVERLPTDIPGEMVTTLAIFEWKDRTDAREQPERAAPPAAVEQPQQAPMLDLAALAGQLGITEAELTARLLNGHGETPAAPEPSIEPEAPAAVVDEDEEDLSSIPPSLR